MTYAEIATAIDRGGCPLCVLRDRYLYRHFFPILYELTKDPEVRQSLRESHGYCVRHTWNLYDTSSKDFLIQGVPVAEIYEDLLSQELESLEAPEPAREQAPCPACEHEQFMEEALIPKMRSLLAEPEFRKEWFRSGLLCIPHYRRLIQGQERAPWRAYLVEKEHADLEALLDELADYLKKQDYQQPRPTRREETAWIRAIVAAAGLRYDGKKPFDETVKP